MVDQRWVVASSGTAVDRFGYTYDRSGNRLTRSNGVNSAFSEVYGYDSLDQLVSTNRGSGTRTQNFDYDAVGNRDSVTTNGSTQTYTANKKNEITSISGATTPTYDLNGNMTGDETGKTLVYNAWNKLVAVKNGATTLVSYQYDGLGRRVIENTGTARDLYYSSQWQVLEERIGTTVKASYVWSPVYVDALIARDRPDMGDRQYVLQDANFNVTAIASASGTVLERYAYDAYGTATIMNASWTAIGSSAYGWQYLHQGGRLDSVSGLYHFRNRDYSASLGRWVTMDPIRYEAGDVNLYGYVARNPIKLLDSSGLLGILGGLIGAVVGAGAGGGGALAYEIALWGFTGKPVDWVGVGDWTIGGGMAGGIGGATGGLGWISSGSGSVIRGGGLSIGVGVGTGTAAGIQAGSRSQPPGRVWPTPPIGDSSPPGGHWGTGQQFVPDPVVEPEYVDITESVWDGQEMVTVTRRCYKKRGGNGSSNDE